MVSTVDKNGKHTSSSKTSTSQESTTSEPSQGTDGQLSEEHSNGIAGDKELSTLMITDLGRATVKGEL